MNKTKVRKHSRVIKGYEIPDKLILELGDKVIAINDYMAAGGFFSPTDLRRINQFANQLKDNARGDYTQIYSDEVY